MIKMRLLLLPLAAALLLSAPVVKAAPASTAAITISIQNARTLQDYGLPPSIFVQGASDIIEEQTPYRLYTLTPSSPTALGLALLQTLNGLSAEQVSRLTHRKLGLVLMLLNEWQEKVSNAKYAAYPALLAAFRDRINQVLDTPAVAGDPPAGFGKQAASFRETLGNRQKILKTALDALSKQPNAPKETREQLAFMKRVHDEMSTLMLDSKGQPLLPQTLEKIVRAVPEEELTQAQWRLLFESYPGGKTLWNHRVDRLWRGALNGAGVSIALLDTGVDALHPHLKDSVVIAGVYGSTYTSRSGQIDHRGERGTMAASLAASIAPQARLLNVKVTDDLSARYTYDASNLVKSHDQALRDIVAHNEGVAAGRVKEPRIDVVSFGLGIPASPSIYFDTTSLRGITESVIKLAQQGVLIVAPATEIASLRGWPPESLPEILTVGVVDYFGRMPIAQDRKPAIAALGSGAIKPELYAYGRDVEAAVYSERGAYTGLLTAGWSATAAAVAQTAAVAALVIQEARRLGVDLTAAQVKRVLVESGSPTSNGNPYVGGAVLNADRAVAFLRERLAAKSL